MRGIFLAGLMVLLGPGLTRGENSESPAPLDIQNPRAKPTSNIGQGTSNDRAGSEQNAFSFQVDDGPANGSSERFWVGAEYLLWWVKGDSLPPLISTSPVGTPQAQAGLLSTPSTTVLFGGSAVNDDARSGWRISGGYWLPCRPIAIEADFFQLERLTARFSAASNGSPILARPFFNALTNLPDSELIAFPGLVAGQVSAGESSNLLGAGARLRINLCCLQSCDCCGASYRLDGLLGYRFLQLHEELGITETLISTNPASPAPLGTTLVVSDRFDTRNEFHGADLGLIGEVCRGRWGLEALIKLAVGQNECELNVSGATTVTVPGFPSFTQAGGLLALGSNSGHFSKNRFSLVPEAAIRLGYRITPHWRATIGYDLFFWTDIIRPGKQIDTAINPDLLPPVVIPTAGPNRPQINLDNTSTLWVQGLTLGMEFRY